MEEFSDSFDMGWRRTPSFHDFNYRSITIPLLFYCCSIAVPLLFHYCSIAVPLSFITGRIRKPVALAGQPPADGAQRRRRLRPGGALLRVLRGARRLRPGAVSADRPRPAQEQLRGRGMRRGAVAALHAPVTPVERVFGTRWVHLLELFLSMAQFFLFNRNRKGAAVREYQFFYHGFKKMYYKVT